MRLLRALSAIALAAWAAASHAFPAAADLRAEAADGAVIVLFSLPGCRYCDEVRALHLAPLMKEGRLHGRLVVREVDLSSDAPLVDFDGARTTHRVFARRHGARIAPTLVALRRDGSRAGEAIVGAKIPEFYGAYLDRLVAAALDQGRR